MAITLERTVKPVAATRNLTHEDFLDSMDRIEPAVTPMLSLCRNEVALGATERKWNVDSFQTPKGAVGRADDAAADTATDWTSNVRPMGNIGQGFSHAFGAGWIAQSVPKVAGIKDPLAYAKAGAYLLLKQEMEQAFCSFDQTALAEQTYLGSLGGGYRSLIDYANRYTAFSSYAVGKPTDVHYSPTAACIGCDTTAFTATGGALSSLHSRAMWKNVAYALRVASKRSTDWTLLCGLGLRQAITDLTEAETTTATSTATSVYGFGSQVRVFSKSQDDAVLGGSVDVIRTDFGRFAVAESDYIGTTKNSSANTAISNVDHNSATGLVQRKLSSFNSLPKAGLIIQRGNVWKSWGVPFYTEELAKTGAGNQYDAKGFAMLGLQNPIKAGVIYFSS